MGHLVMASDQRVTRLVSPVHSFTAQVGDVFTVRVVFDPMRLGPGNYYVSLSAFEPSDEGTVDNNTIRYDLIARFYLFRIYKHRLCSEQATPSTRRAPVDLARFGDSVVWSKGRHQVLVKALAAGGSSSRWVAPVDNNDAHGERASVLACHVKEVELEPGWRSSSDRAAMTESHVTG